MAAFSYTARDTSGAAVSGVIDASSLAEATAALRAEGKYPTSITAAEREGGAAAWAAVSERGVRLSRKEVIQLSTQLAIMVETGVTLSEALDSIAKQADKPAMRRLVEDVARHVQGGGDFSGALARHPRSFPRLYLALIKASERGGMMGRMLQRATAYLRDEQEIVRKVRGALIYPAIMFSFACTTTIFLLTFVLPKFTAIYASKGAALPAPTKLLMGASDFLIGHKLAIATGLLTAGTAFYGYFRTAGGRRVRDYIQLHVPLLGGMFRKMHLARSLRMIGTMAGAGINLVDAVHTAHDLCDNSYFRELWTAASEQIQAGRQLSEPLFASPLVPRSVAQMIHSGEKGGKLSIVLEQVSGYAEEELKEKIGEMTRYIEPLMILVMGFIIGGVALALLLPIFTISRVVAS